MTDHCSFPAALAVCAAAGLAALSTSVSVAQQAAAPQHRERGTLVFQNIPLPDTALMARLQRFQQSREATFLDWLAAGGMLVATGFGVPEPLARVAGARAAHRQRLRVPQGSGGR